MTKGLDRASLKTLIVNLLKSDEELCHEVLKEINDIKAPMQQNTDPDKRKKLEKIIDEDFKEYEEVFKALA